MFLLNRMSLKIKDVSWTVSKHVRNISLQNNLKSVILGIETSCDDTGCAIVDSTGRILGEALHSQQQIHLE